MKIVSLFLTSIIVDQIDVTRIDDEQTRMRPGPMRAYATGFTRQHTRVEVPVPILDAERAELLALFERIAQRALRDGA